MTPVVCIKAIYSSTGAGRVRFGVATHLTVVRSRVGVARRPRLLPRVPRTTSVWSRPPLDRAAFGRLLPGIEHVPGDRGGPATIALSQSARLGGISRFLIAQRWSGQPAGATPSSSGNRIARCPMPWRSGDARELPPARRYHGRLTKSDPGMGSTAPPRPRRESDYAVPAPALVATSPPACGRS